MPQRQRNQPRTSSAQNTSNTQDTQTGDGATPPSSTADNPLNNTLPLDEPQAPRSEPPPVSVDPVPRVQIEKLPEQTTVFSTVHDTLEICCRKWQFEAILELPPHPRFNYDAVMIHVEDYSGQRQTIVATMTKNSRELHVFRISRGGADVFWETGYRLVIPNKPWPAGGLRALNRNEFS